MELGKTSHCIYKIRYHLVTAIKYLKLLFNSEVEECIKETIKGISERYDILIDEIGFDKNHIHIFCGAKPSMSPMQIINIIKSITARRVFETFPRLRKKELWGGELWGGEFWGGEFWSDGKYIGTVGEATSEKVVRKYIRNQSIDKSESGGGSSLPLTLGNCKLS
ncbi:MAG: IS200/IS605 family transposase [Desulfobacteraceae bacterium]|nr:IS200/IS605 family transposase [Desulfobacteraceae bacterium]